jgi:hypothetical protein
MRGARLFGISLGVAAAFAACSSSSQQADAGIGGGGTTGNSDAQTFDVGFDGARPKPGTVRMAVPAYFEPGPEWQRLISAAPVVGMIVFNPDSGPGTATDPLYTQALSQAETAGITVLGYVATNYGARAEADVIADINKYYDLYTPSGIYFAEGPMDADCTPMEAMYHRMADAVHARDPHAFLAVGTRFCPTYIYFFDMMVQFARNWSEYQTDYTPPSWMPANSPQRFVHFIHDVPASDASAALSRVIANGAGWVFVTDQTDPNPWSVLPSYFDEELATLRGISGIN